MAPPPENTQQKEVEPRTYPQYPDKTPWKYIDIQRQQEILGGLTSAMRILAEGGENLVSKFQIDYPGIPAKFIEGPIGIVWAEVERMYRDPEMKIALDHPYTTRIAHLRLLKKDHPELLTPTYENYLK